MSKAGEQGERTPLWDLPVRIAHWSFVVLIPAMWWTAENHEMGLHLTLGMILLALLAFRIAWGFVGGSTARFAAFVRGPAAVLRYLRGEGGTVAGHNPAGGWSVVALLGLMSLQVGLGLFSGDPDDGSVGPLNGLISYAAADNVTDLHEWLFNILAAFIALHIAAVLFYRLIKRDDIIRPMIGGSRHFASSVTPLRRAPPLRAILCAIGAAAIAGWIWIGAPIPGLT